MVPFISSDCNSNSQECAWPERLTRLLEEDRVAHSRSSKHAPYLLHEQVEQLAANRQLANRLLQHVTIVHSRNCNKQQRTSHGLPCERRRVPAQRTSSTSKTHHQKHPAILG